MKAALLAVVATAAAAILLVPSLGLGGGDGRKVLEARVLGAVAPPYTGATNPIRDVPGAGAAWVIGDSEIDLRSDGRLKIEVNDLVLAGGTSGGTNPIASFDAIVSCQTAVNGAAAVSNVRTESFPANTAGDAEFEGQVALPSPCFAPIVFVAIPGSPDRWLAVTGR